MLLDTPVCDFGWQGPDFTLPDAHGRQHRMQDHLGGAGLLVAFICNHCPYVMRIADQLAADAAALMNEGIGVLAVMSNDFDAYPADRPEEMVRFAAAHGFNFPYLVDADQAVAQAYGAVCTPDFFGFNASGGLQYRGRLTGPDGTRDLLEGMRQVAATGRGPQAQVASMGCSIKWR
ncbi:thioredoxin family protein [uncultured Tateyamaria sp.]|uniref:thioredoxin family protein n=1 Tax=Tateyamaria sp. 1078 TaxID=3417464 RepID=UPI00261524BD|nr:thioredoxin family protein [uncultured Tateyamaria sp.]